MDDLNGLTGIDRGRLQSLVRESLGRDTADLADWRLAAIRKGADMGSGVYRVAATARDRAKELRWSVILKLVRPVRHELGPSGWHYWRRGSLAYTSGLLGSLPAGLAAPRCLGVEDHGSDCSRMWLEDVAEAPQGRWTLPTYSRVARQLGRFNGAYLTGERPIPAYPWLSKDWLRGWTEKSAPAIALFPGILESPLIRRCFPTTPMIDAYLRIWDERVDFLDVLKQPPQVFCHHDAFRRNLFLRRDSIDDPLLAIDWAFAGPGAVGEELVPLVLAGIAFFEVDPSIMGDLEQVAYEAYLEGLRDAGWQGDPRIVRLGYAASAALRYGPGCAVPALLAIMAPSVNELAPQLFGVPAEEVADRSSAMFARVLDLADEARQLMDVFSQTASR